MTLSSLLEQLAREVAKVSQMNSMVMMLFANVSNCEHRTVIDRAPFDPQKPLNANCKTIAFPAQTTYTLQRDTLGEHILKKLHYDGGSTDTSSYQQAGRKVAHQKSARESSFS